MQNERLPILKRLWSLPGHSSMTRQLGRLQSPGSSSQGVILVVRLDQIGDVILTYPLLAALKEVRPNHHLVLVTKPGVAEFAKSTSPADEIFSFDPGNSRLSNSSMRRQVTAMRLARRLVNQVGAIELAIVPRRGLDYLHATQLAALCNPDRLAGFGAAHQEPTQVFQKSRTLLDLDVDIKSGIHESRQPFAILDALHMKAKPRPPHFELPTDAIGAAEATWDRLAGKSKRVVLVAGAGHPRRQWPTERFAQVLETAGTRVPMTCIALGTADESALTPPSTDSTTIHNHCGHYSLLESAALIACSDVVLTNETGPMHIAAALNRPLVAVSCHPEGGDPDHVNAPERFGPLSENARLARPSSATPGCETGCDADAPCCILRITADEVLKDFSMTLKDLDLESPIEDRPK